MGFTCELTPLGTVCLLPEALESAPPEEQFRYRARQGKPLPFIEVHLSNVYRREAFRHHSYFSDIAVGVVCGLGPTGYRLALDYALNQLAVPAQ